MLSPGTGGGSARSSVSSSLVGAQWGPEGGRYTSSSSEDNTARATYHRHTQTHQLCLPNERVNVPFLCCVM